jgi:hypothetical protein
MDEFKRIHLVFINSLFSMRNRENHPYSPTIPKRQLISMWNSSEAVHFPTPNLMCGLTLNNLLVQINEQA